MHLFLECTAAIALRLDETGIGHHHNGMKLVRTVLDVEASAKSWFGYPVEIAFASTWEDGQITTEFSFIRHDVWLDHLPWTQEAENLHKLSKEFLVRAGRPVLEVAHWLNQRLDGMEGLVGDELDMEWIKRLYKEAGIEPSFTLRLIKDAFPEFCLLPEEVKDHRAAPDAAQVSQTLVEQLRLAA